MNNVDNLVAQKEVAKEMIATGESYVRLTNNADFKFLIQEEYFQKEAARLVMAKSNGQLTPEEQSSIDRMIIGVGSLATYFELVMQRAAMAQSDLEALSEEEEEIAAVELH